MRTPALSRPRPLWLALAAVLVTLAPAASAVTIDWVSIGDPGNAGDTQVVTCCGPGVGTSGYGDVAYSYRISKYEVTNAQYAEFLNAKAASDPLALYSTSMGSSTVGGITRSGISGSYTYSAKPGFENKPVNFVGVFDAMRFTNWLNNGQGSASTETGAYQLLGGTAVPTNQGVLRDPLASIFLPSEEEWYKAAYYDATSASFFDYPAGTDTASTCAAPTATANRANCGGSAGLAPTIVGAYTNSASPYGTFDQGGNVQEWTDTFQSGGNRVQRGGEYGNGAVWMSAGIQGSSSPVGEAGWVGFRVASIPEPGTGVLLLTGLLGLAARRLRRE